MTTRGKGILVAAALLLVLIPIVRVHADGTASTSTSIVEQIGCDISVKDADGTIHQSQACQLTDFINLFVYLTKWGFSILAILAVLMMIYGGFQFVTAGGRSSKVDEGKRVINGTIIGTIVALTAYIIINSTVTAISGTSIVSKNPFGVIATVFGSNRPENTVNGQTIKRVFSGNGSIGGGGSGSESDIPSCRLATSTWDRVQITTVIPDPTFTTANGAPCYAINLSTYCADSGTKDRGPVTQIQEKLNTKNCGCGSADGCFGPVTARCVQKFQIANLLPATGAVDRVTSSLILSGGGKACDSYADPATPTSASQDVSAIIAKLPDTKLSTASNLDTGCCIVNDGANDLYCLDDVSTRVCQSAGDSNTFLPAPKGTVSGKCAGIPEARGRCGFCSNSNPNHTNDQVTKCFQPASKYWCEKIGQSDLNAASLYFFKGSCNGSCSSCANALELKPS